MKIFTHGLLLAAMSFVVAWVLNEFATKAFPLQGSESPVNPLTIIGA